ncbi:hypothetical protein MCHI_001030 [Candidatus Magnetoovum chiemensis]|nr:hypothetical protein MCHI_001030 [Candidatus Magnetoovum chiemensis]
MKLVAINTDKVLISDLNPTSIKTRIETSSRLLECVNKAYLNPTSREKV